MSTQLTLFPLQSAIIVYTGWRNGADERMHRMFCGYMGWWWESNVPRSSCLDKYDYHLNLTFNLVEYVLYIRASVILVTIIAITRSHIIFFRILPSHLTHAPSLFTYSIPTHLFLPFTLSSSSCPSLSRQCSR